MYCKPVVNASLAQVAAVASERWGTARKHDSISCWSGVKVSVIFFGTVSLLFMLVFKWQSLFRRLRRVLRSENICCSPDSSGVARNDDGVKRSNSLSGILISPDLARTALISPI